jgi:hypothetical protein
MKKNGTIKSNGIVSHEKQNVENKRIVEPLAAPSKKHYITDKSMNVGG